MKVPLRNFMLLAAAVLQGVESAKATRHVSMLGAVGSCLLWSPNHVQGTQIETKGSDETNEKTVRKSPIKDNLNALTRDASTLEWGAVALATIFDTLGQVASQESSLPRVLFWVDWLRMLPLRDPRFILCIGIVFTGLAFVGNLLTQYHVEEQNAAEAKENVARERHKYILSVLHFLLEDKPRWLDVSLAQRCVDEIQKDTLAEEECATNETYGYKTVAMVDFALILQYLATSPPIYKRLGVELITGADQVPGQKRKSPSSRAVQIRMHKLLYEGPDAPDDLLASAAGLHVIGDFLTHTLVVVVNLGHVQFQEVIGILEHGMSKMKELTDEVKCVAQVQEIATSLFNSSLLGKAGALATSIQALEDGDAANFKLMFTGYGLAGTVANALAVLARSFQGKDERDATASEMLKSAKAVAFGDMPWFSYTTEKLDYVTSVALGSDIMPRLGDRNVAALFEYFAKMDHSVAAGTRLLSLYSAELSPQTLATTVKNLLDSYPALISGSSTPSDAQVYHPGRVVFFPDSQGSVECDGPMFSKLPLIASSRILCDHDLDRYGAALRQV